MKRLIYPLLGLALAISLASAQNGAAGGKGKDEFPPDSRLKKVKNLNDKDFFFTPPKTKDEWEKRRQQLKEQVLVANGLWPMPARTPMHPVVHGKIQREGYTVEKVFFESYPGFYVTGNLYRPSNPDKKKLPGVLCPHGHWKDGRFNETDPPQVAKDIKDGAEKTEAGAKYLLQARCANLAMLGCVVFHYDMVGYADSKQIPHREGFKDPEAELRLESFMGLQTWNSIRALDFLTSLPDVDTSRIGVTGASGGGTQTFILCAVDDRPTVAFPAVMVSTAMQGGCVCENCDYLRLGTGNVELAALFAPKPLAMTGADDWTKEIETKGYPELKAVYKLYGAEDKVEAKAFTKFGHNYNQVAREMMYNWFNKHLKLGHKESVTEKPFVPVPPKELSVFDDKHPLPDGAKDVKELRDYLTSQQKQQLKSVFPLDVAQLGLLRMVNGTALRVMMNDTLPAEKDVDNPVAKGVDLDTGLRHFEGYLTRRLQEEVVPYKLIEPTKGKRNDAVVVWIHPDGIASLEKGGKLVPAADAILKQGGAILAIDPFWTGPARGVVIQVKPDAKKLKAVGLTLAKVQAEIAKAKLGQSVGDLQYLFGQHGAGQKKEDVSKVVVGTMNDQPILLRDVATIIELPALPIHEGYAGFTFGYNRTLLANRVHDILSAVAFAKRASLNFKTVHLAGFGKAGPWVVLARGLCGDAVTKTAADMNQFRFQNILSMQDEMMQPGALKYGGMPALTALCAPHELFLHNMEGVDNEGWIAAAYQAAGQPKHLQQQMKKASMEQVVNWLLPQQ